MRGLKTTATCSSRPPFWEPDVYSRSLQDIRLCRIFPSFLFHFLALQGTMADDQPSQDIIETSSRSETELFRDAIQSSLADFTIQVTQILGNKLGEIKEQLVSNKSLKSGSLFCNQNDQQLSGESAKVHTDRPTVDDYNTQHDTSSGCGVQHNREVDQDSISVHAGDDDMTVSSHSEAETDLEGKIVKFVSMSSSSDRGNLSTKSVLNVLTQDLVDIESCLLLFIQH